MPEIVSQKICAKCKQTKESTEFYKHKRDGCLFGKCKSCWIKKTTEYNRSEKGKLVTRKARSLYNCSDHAKKMRLEYARKERAKHRQKRKVRFSLIKAVWSGKIDRPEYCQKCSAKCKPDAHHYLGYDWGNRFKVQWLCKICHKAEHLLISP